ncbi:hypothetical protein EDB84DRAFT_1597127 [Lactarius hengduanensis]|nr:hypothetical protein EDB84DRAFT_1597127 [Lactarius hengduanensis]
MGHGAVSLRRVGVVGVDGPRRRVGVEVPQHRVVTMRRCRRCRRATTPCRYGASVSMGHGAASVSKGHGAVLLRRVGVVGVDGPRRRVVTPRPQRRIGVEGPWRRVVTPRGCRRCRWATTPCRWGASVSMGHGAAWVSKGHGAVSLRHDAAWVSMGYGAAWVSKGHDAAWVSKGRDAA